MRGESYNRRTKMENKKAAGLTMDRFHCLPDELLLSIFTVISDVKSLCQCSLVCKRFAFMVSQVRTVSVTLHMGWAHSAQFYKNTCAPLCQMDKVTFDNLSFLKLLSPHEFNLPIFLRKFKELESVNLEYSGPQKPGSSSLLRWKVKCQSNNFWIKKFVALLPASVCKKGEENEPALEQENPLEFVKSQIMDCFWLSYGRYLEWLWLTCLLIKYNVSLTSVAITDSEKRGKSVTRDEQIAKIRSCALEKERDGNNVYNYMDPSLKIAWIPVLHLPLSGYVMREVCLMVIEIPAESCAGSKGKNGEEEDIMAWEFEEEVFGEAVREIMKNHAHKFMVAE